MKRNLLLLMACLLVSLQGFCQFGVKAGMNFNSFGDVKADYDKSSIANTLESAVQNKTGFHVGVLYKFQIPLVGVAVQPELIYSQTKGDIELKYSGLTSFKSDVSVDYLQLPVSLQWGPDLLMFRPFVDVTPFVGYALNNEASGVKLQGEFMSKVQNKWEGVNRLEYGLGLGGGIEIWKLQLVCRYNWNFGDLFNADGGTADWNEIWNTATDSVKTGKNFGGVTLSLAFLF